MTFPEILAPAGNLFKLKTAVRYGADAVYIAGRKFGLRSGADNFSAQQIAAGCAYAHQHGAKVYVVLNAFLFDQELAELPPFLTELEQAGVDAVIVSDLGVVTTVVQHAKLEVHLSTQASALSTAAARFWKSQGVKRIVVGREVSIEEAATIKRDAQIEIEVFGHGAMCMAFSGNCVISNYTAGRDSNRGGCIQSCRFKYKLSESREADSDDDGFFFSSKDLRGIQHMEAFHRHQIDSLKIEGRMKSPLYVATTVRAYKAARDAAVQKTQPDVASLFRELGSMSHRDYTDANLAHKAGADSVYHHEDIHQPNSHEMLGHILEVRNQKAAIQLKNPLQLGDTLEILLAAGPVISHQLTQMWDITGEPVQDGKPNQVILIPALNGVTTDLLVRKPKHADIRTDLPQPANV